jgi:Domain of unknown function (DUF222)/HNH endonuclease
MRYDANVCSVIDSSSATATVAAATGSASRGSMAGRTAGLAQAIDVLLALDPDGVSDGELAEAMLRLRREQSRLAAAVVELTAAFDARRVHAADGSRSAIDWIAVHARLPRAQAAGEVRDARRVRGMPHTRAAWAAGAISAAHVRVLTGLAGHPRAGAHFPDGEQHLVEQAGSNRFDDWQRICGYWRDVADPDGPERRHGRDEALRRFHIGVGPDGVGHPDGYLTPVGAATVNGALERIERELFEADWAAARAMHGDDTTVAHLARTAAQRHHDALVEMATRALSAPADGRRPASLVTVMVDYPTFAGRVCELAAGTVLAPGAVAELLGGDDTLIERVVFDGTNRLRDVSSARSFRGTLRRVLDVVHRRCEHETCFVPAHLCEGDHIVAWSQGGLTTQDNGQLLCDFHNRWRYTHRQVRPTRPPDKPEPHGAPGPAPPDVALRDGHDLYVSDGARRYAVDLDPSASHAIGCGRDDVTGAAA